MSGLVDLFKTGTGSVSHLHRGLQHVCALLTESMWNPQVDDSWEIAGRVHEFKNNRDSETSLFKNKWDSEKTVKELPLVVNMVYYTRRNMLCELVLKIWKICVAGLMGNISHVCWFKLHTCFGEKWNIAQNWFCEKKHCFCS